MPTPITTTVTIRGMLAVHAARAIFTALSGVDGVSSADVSLGQAIIVHDGRATHARMAEAIALAGCEAVAFVDEKRLPTL